MADETDDTQSDGSSRLAWFVSGAVIGAAVALVYAPASGKESRRYISEKAKKSRDAVTESSKDMTDAGKDLFDRGRKLVEDAADLFERGRKLMRG
jgi:gas vesicle protein